MTDRYDVIIVGSGAGGGTLAHTLAPSGKKIPLLERGDFLPREMQNWEPGTVFVDGRYISPDTWYDAQDKPFQPQVHYFVTSWRRTSMPTCVCRLPAWHIRRERPVSALIP